MKQSNFSWLLLKKKTTPKTFTGTQLKGSQSGIKVSSSNTIYCMEILHKVLGENKRRKKVALLPPAQRQQSFFSPHQENEKTSFIPPTTAAPVSGGRQH